MCEILSQKIENPSLTDLVEAKRIIRYLKYTRNFKLKLSQEGASTELTLFSDANFAEDSIDRKSNSGYISFMNGGPISWCCRKQSLVVLSAMEAEYIALSETCKEMTWLNKLCKFFGYTDETIEIFTDSQACMNNIKNQKFSNRTKHIDVKYHFVKDYFNQKLIELKFVPTELNVADLLTKPLGTNRIQNLNKLAGIQQINN